MKYLLKQRVHIQRKNGCVHIKPGCSGLIRMANKLNLDKKVIQEQKGEYLTTLLYIFKEEDYYWLSLNYREYLKKKRERFYSQEPLIQLVKLLRYIFNRNIRAKEVNKYYSSLQAYNDKDLFLQKALDIAKTIQNRLFSYGFQEDPNESYHNYIYYFEIEDQGQVSFHSNKLYPEIPLFQGEWIGFKNERFPFNLKQIKKHLRNKKILIT